MAIFNRNKKSVDQVPDEVREYYQSERRERVGMAWLLAAGTLVVTLLLAAGLFFGGKWAYDKIANRGNNTQTAQTNQDQQGAPADNQQEDSSSESPASDQTGTSSTSTDTPSDQSPSSGTDSNPETSTTAPADTNAGRGAGEATTSPAPASGQLTNTGPADTLAVFVATTLVAAVAHRVYLARKPTH